MRRLTRRQFIRNSAAAAAPAFVPASLLGRNAPSNRITIGLIGQGNMMYTHLKNNLVQREDVQILAVCDVSSARREFHQKVVENEYGKQGRTTKTCDAVNDFMEIIGRPDIDAVVIATPDHWHAVPAIEACKAKKDVYCEKPLSLTLHEARAMVDAARKYDRVFQTGSQQRSDSDAKFRIGCELIRSGRIGKVRRVEVGINGPSQPCDLPEEEMEPRLDWDRWLGPAPVRPYNSILSPRGVHRHFPDWRKYREYSGGGMTDWGAHHFDITQWALDMDGSGPREIIPPETPGDPGKSLGWRGVRYLYENGVEVVHAGRDGITVHGSDGWIFMNRGKLEAERPELIADLDKDRPVKLYESNDHKGNWIDCIRSRKRPICDVEIGARSVAVCHLGNLAYWTGRKLRWDPAKWRFEDEADNALLTRERRDPYKLPEF